ncbi:hypothetical protein OsJ_08659 [Oryza sativa Japonica Group]|uniref:Uncharacterized protein n=1 Tax=Oryza sativa subsp. japonica TaxID=39947 RepID=B9F3N0_ORYSJ|nr:hypothetical protein OsJ_08659 [Oryza sativa Japonica Group]
MAITEIRGGYCYQKCHPRFRHRDMLPPPDSADLSSSRSRYTNDDEHDARQHAGNEEQPAEAPETEARRADAAAAALLDCLSHYPAYSSGVYCSGPRVLIAPLLYSLRGISDEQRKALPPRIRIAYFRYDTNGMIPFIYTLLYGVERNSILVL